MAELDAASINRHSRGQLGPPGLLKTSLAEVGGTYRPGWQKCGCQSRPFFRQRRVWAEAGGKLALA